METFSLDPNKDYGFTVHRAAATRNLPPWDMFRLQKVREIFQTCDRIIDFGDSSRALSDLLSSVLQGKMKLSVDINPEVARDVVADICYLPFRSSSFDGIICAGILNCVYNPFLAVSEMYRVLQSDGKLFVYVPWMYPSSGWLTGNVSCQGPGYEDYYRFSSDGVRYLFKEFSVVELCPLRGRIETILNFVPRFRKRSRFIRLFGPIIRKLDTRSEVHTSGYNVFCVK